MRVDYSKEYVVIDDLIGGQGGINFIRQLKKENSLSKHYVILDMQLVRESILRKIKNRKYDLMFFVESGGTYFLGIPSIMARGRKSIAAPLSGHSPHEKFSIKKYFDNDEFGIKKILIPLHETILNSQKIAIVEGDVGSGGYSIARLVSLKKAILNLNKNAEVEVIVGVATKKAMVEHMAYGRFFNIVGIVVEDFLKLSDYAHGIETEIELRHKVTPIQRKLLNYLHSRKPHKVPRKIIISSLQSLSLPAQ